MSRLESLPTELFMLVLSDLDVGDYKNLRLLSHAFGRKMIPFVFSACYLEYKATLAQKVLLDSQVPDASLAHLPDVTMYGLLAFGSCARRHGGPRRCLRS